MAVKLLTQINNTQIIDTQIVGTQIIDTQVINKSDQSELSTLILLILICLKSQTDLICRQPECRF